DLGVDGLFRLEDGRHAVHAGVGQLGHAGLALLHAGRVRGHARQPAEDGALARAGEADEADFHRATEDRGQRPVPQESVLLCPLSSVLCGSLLYSFGIRPAITSASHSSNSGQSTAQVPKSAMCWYCVSRSIARWMTALSRRNTGP